METLKAIVTHWFFWGFLLGFFLCVLSLIAHAKTRRELKRYRGHLNDKLEIEAEKMASMKSELEKVRQENENLRLKVKDNNFRDDGHAMERELEIFARAEKAMVVNAPGFAQAWDKAKDGAADELEEEEAGRSLPRRIFRRFFTKGGGQAEAEVIDALPSQSSNADKGAETAS